MPFVTDTFTDTAGTAIASHTGETGATWTAGTANQDNPVISDANRIRPGSLTGQWHHYSSGVPATAEYDVSADFRVITTPAGCYPGIAGRMATGADTSYMARYNSDLDQWELYVLEAGVATLLGSYAQVLSDATTYAVKLEIRTATKKVYIGGVERISSTNDAVTAAGRAGLRGYHANAGDNAAGIHIDNFDASNVAASSAGAGVNWGLINAGLINHGLVRV